MVPDVASNVFALTIKTEILLIFYIVYHERHVSKETLLFDFPENGRNDGGKNDGTKRASVAVGAKWEISDPPPPFIWGSKSKRYDVNIQEEAGKRRRQ